MSDEYKKISLLLDEIGFTLKKYDSDTKVIECLDAGVNQKTFIAEFTPDILKIKNQFGKVIIERFLWSETFVGRKKYE